MSAVRSARPRAEDSLPTTDPEALFAAAPELLDSAVPFAPVEEKSKSAEVKFGRSKESVVDGANVEMPDREPAPEKKAKINLN